MQTSINYTQVTSTVEQGQTSSVHFIMLELQYSRLY